MRAPWRFAGNHGVRELTLPVALRAFIHYQGEESTGSSHRTIEKRQRCQPQETPEPRHDQGQELERQRATDGKREIGIRRQGGAH